METPEHLTHLAEQHQTWLRETIRRFGWAVQGVTGDEEGPPFLYTVGLAGFGHPELILFATAPGIGAAVLNGLGQTVRAGRVLAAGELVRLREGSVHLLSFPASDGWLFAANDLYRRPGGPPVPALLVVPDGELAEP